MLQNNAALKSKINQLWDKFWSGGISNPLTAIEQITYLLFMKQLDDLDLKRIADADFTGEKYTSKFDGKIKLSGTEQKVDKQTLRWSHFKQMPAEEMLSHVQMKVFPFLKMLNGDESPFTHHMQNAVFIIPKPALLVEAISTIEEIFAEIEKDANEGGQAFQDLQGDVYEMLLSEIASAGKNGQFRTPRHIIKLIAELVEPKLGNLIADPACGTGGFLLGAYQYMVTQLDKNKKNIQPDEDGFIRNSVSGLLNKKVSDILNDSLYGYDIDVTMVRLGLMNLMMHGVDTPHIDYKDTLSKGFTESNKYQIIMANPPFTGSIDKGDINEAFKLGTTKTELLFVENIYNLLKMGGTAGVIVPQGVLFGSGKAFVEARKILVEKCELKAVIAMPSGVFKPYAGVSTAILIFTKGGETEKVWFYDMQSDGYSLDDKRTKQEGYGDLQDIVAQFKKRDQRKESDRKEKFFFVLKGEIVTENYDLSMSKYKEDVFEEVVYEKPDVILAKLKTMEGEINQELAELEGMLE
ncbi:MULTISPECIES: type I restriction-modification system subunit M [Pelosinus]|uniref:site-specific DNA-methyltransferase (adenine-specific) n=1 Tax=Pelosinus fermentans B4 TaxID=1149862 RepID=I9LBP1_9FIRM|nr:MULTISPECIES: type I restriction-modification system subunit M [Pelosinus]EIW17756.1 N-6 DNA methylase [Pelosinus fermentans B4]EIW23718.1 N-6 DNA methylase [Pelosinus fermentans A11]OAM94642.1 N-6 DNA methylase [Pelosinus fermentans DSM 17108]SDR14328.1 type I restriction enzyme M protein [Pelosinus fermentans]